MNEGVKRALCDWIFEAATDEELTNFATDIKARKQRELKLITELAGFVGFNSVNGKSKAAVVEPVRPAKVGPVFEAMPEATPASVPVVKATSLIEPPGEASSKIGGDTREKIRAHLKQGPETLQGVASLIKRPSSAAQSLLKLLWERKEVIYDGSKYMLRA